MKTIPISRKTTWTALNMIFWCCVPTMLVVAEHSPNHGDVDDNGLVDLADAAVLINCLAGPTVTPGPDCSTADLTGDQLVDLRDVAVFQKRFGEPTNAAPRMIVLGDSLSDTGLHFDMYGTPAPPSWEGRYSDGPVWVEYLADSLGLMDGEWSNYAVGGAASGYENCCAPDAPGLLDELALLEADVSNYAPLDTNTLFVLWIGANDFEIWNRTNAFTEVSPDVLIHAALANIRLAIESIADMGGRRFLIANLPDLGKIPRVQAAGDPVRAGLATVGTIGFNENLAWMLSDLESELGLDFVFYDVFALYSATQEHPSDFGLTVTDRACMDTVAGTVCSNPDEYLFWDDKHPTSATHRILAEGAMRALQSGGTRLPLACETSIIDHPTVTISTPNGEFTTNATVSITGHVDSNESGTLQLRINGALVGISSDNTFTTDVTLTPGQLEHPIVAELSDDGAILDRDRILVFKGPSISAGEFASSAVLANLNFNGVSTIRDHIIHQLWKHGVLDMYSYFPNPPPEVIGEALGCALLVDVGFTNAGYSCSTVDAQLLGDRIRLKFGLHEIVVGYQLHAWLEGSFCPDPGPDCWGFITIPSFQAFVDVRVVARNGGLFVEALTPIGFAPFSVQHHVIDCDDDLGLGDNVLEALSPKIENSVRAFIIDSIGGVDTNELAKELNLILDGLPINDLFSDALGINAQADFQQVAHEPGALTVSMRTRLMGPLPSEMETYAPPGGPPNFTTLDPVGGRPYDFAASVSLEALNQLLLVKSHAILEEREFSEVDFGSGPLPLTSSLLSLLVPSLIEEDPATQYSLRLRPTLPPMLVNETIRDCDGADLILDQVIVELISESNGEQVPVLAFTTDLRACVSFAYNNATASLSVDLNFSAESLGDIVITENRICANEAVLAVLLRTVVGGLLDTMSQSLDAFPLPDLAGVDVSITQVASQDGYVSFYFDLDPEVGRADFIVAAINAPSEVDVNAPFFVNVLVKNIGHAQAWGTLRIGTWRSYDPFYLSGDDVPLGSQSFNLWPPLNPGKSQWFPVRVHMGDMPNPLPDQQTLFVTVDVPSELGGSGLLCESSETNNYAGVTILTTTVDAYIVSIEPPTGLVGGNGNGFYTVTVGRDDVGLPVIQVPVRIHVGNPVITWTERPIDVPRGGEVTVVLSVPTPQAFGFICGDAVNYFPVSACTNLQFDSNRTNDCKFSTVSVEVPYYDLRYHVDGPDNAKIFDDVNWMVTVCNEGNTTSPEISSRTCIGLKGDSNYLSCVNGSARFFHVLPLLPGHCTVPSFGFSARITPGASGNRFIRAGIDPINGGADPCLAGNQVDDPIWICGGELTVTDIEIPDELVGSVGPRSYRVTIRNSGCDTARGAILRTCIVGSCRDHNVPDILPGRERSISVNLNTPASGGPKCGGAGNWFRVDACLLGWVDSNGSGNCRTEQAFVEVPYWDLQLKITGPDRSVYKCRRAEWTVEITNWGNARFPGESSYRTGICRNSHPFDFSSCAGPPGYRYLEFCIPAIAKGGMFEADIDFDVDCFASPPGQYIKASMTNKRGCSFSDLCPTGDGASPKSITIR